MTIKFKLYMGDALIVQGSIEDIKQAVKMLSSSEPREHGRMTKKLIEGFKERFSD